jgi:hypothetical protein
VIPDSVTYIGKEAFDNCLALEELTLGNGLAEISTGAFYGCRKIKSLSLPESLRYIGEEAFAGLSSLERVNFSEGLERIEPFAFWNSGVENLTFNLPKSVSAIGISAFEKTHWLENQTAEWVIVGNGVLIDYNGTEKNPKVPEEVTFVSNAFDSSPCTAVTLPDTLSGVAAGAFDKLGNLTVLYEGTSPNVLGVLGMEP